MGTRLLLHLGESSLRGSPLDGEVCTGTTERGASGRCCCREGAHALQPEGTDYIRRNLDAAHVDEGA